MLGGIEIIWKARNNSLKKPIFLLHRLIGYERKGMVWKNGKKIRISRCARSLRMF